MEGEVERPEQTPAFADGLFTSPGLMGLANQEGPLAIDFPATDLRTGEGPPWSMSFFTLPRHRQPKTVPPKCNPAQILPGAINVAFYDGHVETAKLERLWSFYWHREYVPPAKRPGLK